MLDAVFGDVWEVLIWYLVLNIMHAPINTKIVFFSSGNDKIALVRITMHATRKSADIMACTFSSWKR